MWRWHGPLSIILLLSLAELISCLCPQVCICDIDERGRKRTRCESGGISIPGNIDIPQLDRDTEVLIVTGSPNRPNSIRLDANMFANKKFKEIHLSYAQNLDYIGERTFQLVSSSLLVLNMTHNALRVVSENNFRNLTFLTHLHLDYNRIASVHSAMFSYLTNLKVLTLTNNLISDVPQRMGMQLGKLEVLDMSHNPIGISPLLDAKQTIPDSFFQDFPNLKVLGLANTSLESLPWISIQKNNLYLRELDMSGNRISSIQPNQLSLIRDLKTVRIANNPIQQIAPGALQGLFLENLDLSGLRAGNVLVPGVFQSARIQRLDVSNTDLRTLDQDVFLPISQDLIGLNVSGNPQLAIRSQMFLMLPQLTTLSMAQMLKPTLQADLFNHENQISYLDLSGNRFTDLPDEFFSPLQNLKTLILANNELRRVPPTVSLPRISEIDLSNNKLSSFPDSLVNAFATPSSYMKSLKLNTNPWNCDCGVASLGRWLASSTGNPGYPAVCIGTGNFTCPVCYEPSSLRNTPLNNLPLQFLDTCIPVDVKQNGSNANTAHFKRHFVQKKNLERFLCSSCYHIMFRGVNVQQVGLMIDYDLPNNRD